MSTQPLESVHENVPCSCPSESPSLFQRDLASGIYAAANGFTRPSFLSDTSNSAASTNSALTPDHPPAGALDNTPPPLTDPRKIHSQPGTLEDSVRALTDLRLYEDQSFRSQLGLQSATIPPTTPLADPRLQAATLTQQLQAANALNQQLQASALSQQMQVNNLNRQLNQQLNQQIANQQLANQQLANQQLANQQYQTNPLSQQLQASALSQQLASSSFLPHGYPPATLTASQLQPVTLVTVPATAAAATAGTSPQQATAVVAASAGGQQLLLTPASMAAAMGSAPTAPARLTLMQPTPVVTTSAMSQASSRSAKIKLLLSSGGHFEKDTTTGAWEYHAGETRLVTVNHTSSLQNLLMDLCKGSSTAVADERVQLKYELPGSPEVLVDLVNDDDVDNMWDEWQSFTLTDKPTYKLHLFVQNQPEDLLSSPGSGSGSGRGSGSGGCGSNQDAPSTPPAAATIASMTSTPRPLSPETLTTNDTITSAPRVDLLDLEGKIELISPDDLTIVRFLGAGGYGEVYLARWHSSDVAVKCLNPSLFSNNGGLGSVSEEVVGELVKEANMLGSLRHPNVVWVYGLVLPTGQVMERLKGLLEPGQSIDAVGFAATAANQTGLVPGVVRPPALVTEFLAGGSLRNAITRKEEWLQSRGVKIKLMLDTARGMEYLHAKRIVHFDLKSGNLLIGFQNRAPVCKVADFGLSKQRQQTYVTGVTSMRGTLPWTAPEIIRSPKAVNEKVDVYSFGICMWEIWTTKEPFDGINYHALLHMMTSQNGLRPPLPGHPEWDLGELEEPAEGWVDLMTRCWGDSPEDRPAFQDIVKELQAMLAAVRSSRRAASA